MPNPRPKQTEEFKRKRFHPIGEVDVPLSSKTTSLRLPSDVQNVLDAMSKEERIIFLRSLITNAVREKVKQTG